MTEPQQQQQKTVLKVVVFAGDQFAIPAINMLLQQQRLAGVILSSQEDQFSAQLQAWLQQVQCPFLRNSSSNSQVITDHLLAWQADLALCFGFNDALPDSALIAVPSGVFQFHASDPKQYNGPMPLYWQIRNSETETYLTLQQVTNNGIGDIFQQHKLAIHPLDTLQNLQNKTAQHTPAFIQQFIEQQQLGAESIQAIEQHGIASPIPQGDDLYVDWLTMSSEQISALARAGNLLFGGCMISLGQMPISLLQATVVNHPIFGVNPGTICYIGEPEGLIVATRNGSVRLDILSNTEGIFSGLNFAERFDINAGTAFTFTKNKP
jgi:methionyl-tRNA formyltransferase